MSKLAGPRVTRCLSSRKEAVYEPAMRPRSLKYSVLSCANLEADLLSADVAVPNAPRIVCTASICLCNLVSRRVCVDNRSSVLRIWRCVVDLPDPEMPLLSRKERIL